MMRRLEAPTQRAASVNSFSLSDRNEARTRRATCIQASTAMTSTMDNTLAKAVPRSASMGMSRRARARMIRTKSWGKDSIMSVKRIRMLSIQPP